MRQLISTLLKKGVALEPQVALLKKGATNYVHEFYKPQVALLKKGATIYVYDFYKPLAAEAKTSWSGRGIKYRPVGYLPKVADALT